MEKHYIQTEADRFTLDGQTVILRGWALGSWMNFEHFMMGLPGTNSMIIDAFREVYGEKNASEFLDSLLQSMVAESDIRYLKSLGTNTVRIPFGYHYFMDDRNPGVFLESGFEKLDRVVKICEKLGMYVILDMHSTPGSQNTDWHSDNITGRQLFWKYRCFQDQGRVAVEGTVFPVCR
jgi:endoglucanase